MAIPCELEAILLSSAQVWLKSLNPVVQDCGARLLVLAENLAAAILNCEDAPEDSNDRSMLPHSKVICRDSHARYGLLWCQDGSRTCSKFDAYTLLTKLTGGPLLGGVGAGADVILWAERLEAGRAVIPQIREIHEDEVSLRCKMAMHMWLQAADPWVRYCGRHLLRLLRPIERKETDVAPPAEHVPEAFLTLPWYVSDAFNHCEDPEMKPRFKGMRDCVICQDENAVFGITYVPPGVYYPSHIHQPLEIYHVFAGSALYTVADEEDIEAVRGGAWPSKVLREVYKEEDFWVHLPYQAHAMETLDQPVLFLWGWVDNLKAVDYSYFEKDIFADQMSFKNETVLEVV